MARAKPNLDVDALTGRRGSKRLSSAGLNDEVCADENFRSLHHSHLTEYQREAGSYVAGPFFRRGEAGVLFGAPGTGKTTLMFQVTMGVGSGSDACGLTIPTPLPTLFYEFEDGDDVCARRYQDNLLTVPDSMRKNLERNFQLRLPKSSQILFPRVADDIRKWAITSGVRDRGGGLVVIDTLHAVLEGDENSSASPRGIWGIANQLCWDFCLCLVFVHHARKASPMGQSPGSSMDRLRGSNAIGASARGLVEISPLRGPHGARLCSLTLTKNNSGPSGASVVLEQCPMTGLWRPSASHTKPVSDAGVGLAPGSGPLQGEVSALRLKALNCLNQVPTPSREELVAQLFSSDNKSTKASLRSLLRHLRVDGFVTPNDQLTPLGKQMLR